MLLTGFLKFCISEMPNWLGAKRVGYASRLELLNTAHSSVTQGILNQCCSLLTYTLSVLVFPKAWVTYANGFFGIQIIDHARSVATAFDVLRTRLCL